MPRDVPKGLIYGLFATSCALLGLVVLALLSPPPPELAARPHASIEAMLSSGAAAPGGAGVLWAGLLTALLTVTMIGLALLMGAAPGARGLKRWIVAGTVAYGLVFIAMMVSYVRYLEGGPIRFLGGLPAPSAWMMYGVWLLPWIFIAGYVATFGTSYFPPESEARFRDLVARKDER